MTNDCIVLNIGRRRQVVEFRQSKAEHVLEPVGIPICDQSDDENKKEMKK